MQEKNRFTMNIGIISFMVIFIVLSLVTFAVLSLVSAKSNMRSATSDATHKSYYYTLNNMANDELERIDEQLAENYQSSDSRADYFSKISTLKSVNSNITIKKHQVSYVIDYRELKLSVTLTVTYPGKHYYKLESWATKPNNEYGKKGTVNIVPDEEHSGTVELWGED